MSTSKETTAKATKTSTAKTSTAKSTAKTETAKTAKATKPAKAEKAPKEKKERKSRKGITRTFAAEVTAVVNPVIASVNAFITDPNTSEEALKMIRLELRKSVKASRATIRGRKTTNA